MRINCRDACAVLDGCLSRFAETCRSVSAEQWTCGTRGGGSGIGDVAQHVNAANAMLLNVLAQLPAQPDVDEPTRYLDEEIPYLFDRGAQAPDLANATDVTGDQRAWFDEYAENADRMRDMVSEANDGLRAKRLSHPVFGPLDGVQWILFIAAHTERHRAQILGMCNECMARIP